MGVAFLDYNKQGQTLGRAWLIKKSQYKEIKLQEGPSWYDCELDLGHIMGIPVKTITETYRSKDNLPSDKYKSTIDKGSCEVKQLAQKYNMIEL